MGISGISPGSLLLILIIVVLLFGTGRLRNLGKDLGEMTKGFQEGLNDIDKVKYTETTLTPKSTDEIHQVTSDESVRTNKPNSQ